MAEQHSQTADYDNRWKFTGHELDRETGLYYAGARYYDPKVSIWLSVDPLAEKYPNWNPYNYVMQNPINLIDPTGMSPEDSSDGPKPGWFRKFFNSIIFGKKNLNPDGTAVSKYSTATGWKRSTSNNNSEKSISSPTRIVQEAITSDLVPSEISPSIQVIEADVLFKRVMTFKDNSSSIDINGRKVEIESGTNNIDFVFANIGSIASRSTDGVNIGQNRITKLSNDQISNLNSIADFLIQNPEASVCFQFPTPLRSSHPNFNRDLTTLYGMSFQQITRFLVNQGVTNPNR